MSLDAHDMGLIEKSIDGSLTSVEREEFEEKVATSEVFKENLKFQRSLLSSLEANRKAKLKQELTEMLGEVGSNKKQTSTLLKRWHMIAASVLLLLGSIWIFRISESNNEPLYVKYYDPYQNILTSRSSGREFEWSQAYSQANYEGVIKVLGKEENKSDTANFYLAISYMSTKNYADAAKCFSEVSEHSIFYQPKTWYLGLSHIALGNNQEAKDVFYQMQSFEFKKDEAKELLKLLD